MLEDNTLQRRYDTRPRITTLLDNCALIALVYPSSFYYYAVGQRASIALVYPSSFYYITTPPDNCALIALVYPSFFYPTHLYRRGWTTTLKQRSYIPVLAARASALSMLVSMLDSAQSSLRSSTPPELRFAAPCSVSCGP
ncbi:hypothetical protein B0H16DRAFT_314598 [Mycena metata]|uniref:Uncharacterized protein n=1 Tax=Mycena metata TaxID=1033252 RepID=A0AAD7JN28_9AGAR|nr:hypothetical protein B0H16DRAFT_314598 [Mycena metata]